MELIILFGCFFILLILGTPVAFSLAAASVATLLYMDISPVIAFQRMISGINVFALLALPFFIYAGELMTRGGIAEKLLALGNAAVGHLRGGLGMVNVTSSMAFGGISGSAVADVSALGSTLIPMMEKRGYRKEDAVNITISSSILGLLIPPSHNMIIFAVAAGGSVSISGLFVAGLLPGLITGLILMLAVYIIALKRGYPAESFPGWQVLLQTFALSIPGLLTAVIILLGVLTGVFTATESAAIAVLWAILVSIVVYKSLSWDAFLDATRSACKTTAMVMLVIGAASGFGWVLAVNDVPLLLANWLGQFADQPVLLFLLILLVLLLLGAIMDMAPLIMIVTPILLPVTTAAGMDPLQFGIVMILGLGIGLLTPPVGSVLFVGCALGKTSVEQVTRTIWPFYLALFVALLAVTFLPSLSLWLPGIWMAGA